MTSFWQHTKQLIGLGSIDQAIEVLHQNTSKKLEKEVLLYKARFVELNRLDRLNVEDITVEKSKLILDLLTFIQFHEGQEVADFASVGLTNLSDLMTFRAKHLKERLQKLTQLLNDWQEKLENAENPGEINRSRKEIARLEMLQVKYLEELNRSQ